MEFDYFYNRDGERFSYYMLSKIFAKVIKSSGIEYIRTRLYSSWQNKEVERSHKVDNELFYNRRRFKSEVEMYKSFEKHSTETNPIARSVLSFRMPNEIVSGYFSECNICLDN